MRTFFIALLLSAISIFVVQFTVLAGGGNYQPVNFTSGDVVGSRSRDVVVKVYDWSTSPDQAKHKDQYGSPLMVGEEFKFQVHQDLQGAECITTQSRSDEAGQIKATCKANANGRFVFHIEPLTKTDVGNSPEFILYLSEGSGSSSSSSAPQASSIVSTADGPCGSGSRSLSYFTGDECKRGDHQVGYLVCNNGFAAKLTRNECVSQMSHTWDDLMKQICGHWACKDEHISFIDTPGTQLVVLKPSSPKRTTTSATTNTNLAKANTVTSPQAYFLLTESPSDEKQGFIKTTLYLKGTLDKNKKYQAYFFPIMNAEYSSIKLEESVKVLPQEKDPWKILNTKYNLGFEESSAIATLKVQPQFFTQSNKDQLEAFINQNNLELTESDERLLELWIYGQNTNVMGLLVDNSSFATQSAETWLPTIQLEYGSSSVVNFSFPFAWQQDDMAKSFGIDYTLTFLTTDPFVARNTRGTWTQKAYDIEPNGVQLFNSGYEGYVTAQYLSVLRGGIQPNDTSILLIEREYPEDGKKKLESQVLMGDPKPDPTPQPIVLNIEELASPSNQYFDTPLKKSVWFASGVVLLVIISASYWWLKKRKLPQAKQENPENLPEPL